MGTVSLAGRAAPRRGSLTIAVLADDAFAEARAGALLTEAGAAVERWKRGTAAVSQYLDVLLVMLTSDGSARAETIGDIADEHRGIAMVATMPDDAGSGLLRQMLRAGADGIVLEGELDRALVPSIQAVSAGQLAVPTRLRRQIAPRHLSYREKQILSLVVIGYTNRQIADELVLAESTVKTHLSSAFAKLDARSRAEAAALVLDPDEGYRVSMAPVLADVAAPAA